MLTFLVGARSGYRQATSHDNACDLVPLQGVSYSDSPEAPFGISTARLHVAARVNVVVPVSVAIQDRAGAVDGPALDQPGGGESAVDPRRKITIRRLFIETAQVDRLVHERTSVRWT